MVGIAGIGNLNEPQVARSIKDPRGLSSKDSVKNKQDGVQFSPAGNEAAEAARFIRESVKAAEIRQERVDAARKNVEQGRHRVENVVNIVASTLVPFL